MALCSRYVAKSVVSLSVKLEANGILRMDVRETVLTGKIYKASPGYVATRGEERTASPTRRVQDAGIDRVPVPLINDRMIGTTG